jgi:acyl carrier protein
MTLHEEIKSHILAFVSNSLAAGGPPRRISDDFDLRLDGGIDSLGFLRLITELEARTGRTVDLADLAPEEVTKLGVLAAHIANQMGPTT